MARSTQSRRQERPKRQDAQRILVVTEGTETEPQYVERLDAFLRSKDVTTVVKSFGVGKDPLKVVEKCIDLRDQAKGTAKEYDICVCLVDVDQHTTLLDAARLAGQEKILLLVTNLKFEMWLRWHVESKRSTLTTGQLDALMKKLDLVDRKKLSPKFPFDGVHSACEVARQADRDMSTGRVGPDPSSALPILVDLLLGKPVQ